MVFAIKRYSSWLMLLVHKCHVVLSSLPEVTVKTKEMSMTGVLQLVIESNFRNSTDVPKIGILCHWLSVYSGTGEEDNS